MRRRVSGFSPRRTHTLSFSPAAFTFPSTRVTHFNTRDATTSVSTRPPSPAPRQGRGHGPRGAARGASSRTPIFAFRNTEVVALQAPGTRPRQCPQGSARLQGGRRSPRTRGPGLSHDLATLSRLPRGLAWVIRSARALQARAHSRVTRTASVTHVTNVPSGKPFQLRFWDRSSHRPWDTLPGRVTVSAFPSVGSASALH